MQLQISERRELVDGRRNSSTDEVGIQIPSNQTVSTNDGKRKEPNKEVRLGRLTMVEGRGPLRELKDRSLGKIQMTTISSDLLLFVHATQIHKQADFRREGAVEWVGWQPPAKYKRSKIRISSKSHFVKEERHDNTHTMIEDWRDLQWWWGMSHSTDFASDP